jgi:hypothetical protein
VAARKSDRAKSHRTKRFSSQAQGQWPASGADCGTGRIQDRTMNERWHVMGTPLSSDAR